MKTTTEPHDDAKITAVERKGRTDRNATKIKSVTRRFTINAQLKNWAKIKR